MVRLCLSAFLLAAFAMVSLAEELPLILKEDFETGADRWEPKDPKQWQVQKTAEGHIFSQHKKQGSYKPPHRSPVNICLLKDVVVGDFEFTAKVKSTHSDYGHRDAVVVFGYQDPAHFYYVHLATKADDHANQIFIVNGAARKRISAKTTEGTSWTEDWHKLRVVRKMKDATIEIYYDDMENPVMKAKDDTFKWGQVGMGTFDDTSDWDNVQLRGREVKK